jgi:tRNA A37 N6-isopentenylltransferase MiaA
MKMPNIGDKTIKEALAQDWQKLTSEAAELKTKIEAGQGGRETQARCKELLEKADETWNWMQVDPRRLQRAIETGEV